MDHLKLIMDLAESYHNNRIENVGYGLDHIYVSDFKHRNIDFNVQSFYFGDSFDNRKQMMFGHSNSVSSEIKFLQDNAIGLISNPQFKLPFEKCMFIYDYHTTDEFEILLDDPVLYNVVYCYQNHTNIELISFMKSELHNAHWTTLPCSFDMNSNLIFPDYFNQKDIRSTHAFVDLQSDIQRDILVAQVGILAISTPNVNPSSIKFIGSPENQ